MQDKVYSSLNSTLATLQMMEDWVNENVRVPSVKNDALAQIAALEATVEATYAVCLCFGRFMHIKWHYHLFSDSIGNHRLCANF